MNTMMPADTRLRPGVLRAWLLLTSNNPEQPVESSGDFSREDALAAEATYYDNHRFLEIYNRYYATIYNYLHRRTADHDTTADLTSQVFINALQWLTTRQATQLKVKPWLYSIATNAYRQHARRNTRWLYRVPLLGERLIATAAASLPTEEHELLKHYIARLPEKYQLPLILRYYEGMSYSEIAAATGIAEASARSRVNRALDKLARCFEERR